jgi:hypothetical protein
LVLADHPFNPTQKVSYFEMEVVDRGQKGWIAIGLSVFDYPLTHHPGWRRGCRSPADAVSGCPAQAT